MNWREDLLIYGKIIYQSVLEMKRANFEHMDYIVCLFVCFESHEQFFSYLAIWIIQNKKKKRKIFFYDIKIGSS
jgi:hypothetical protein